MQRSQRAHATLLRQRSRRDGGTAKAGSAWRELHAITMEVCDMPPEKCILPLEMRDTLSSMMVVSGKLASAGHGSLL